jgi:aspartyl-tRNA(Asn)/glutamyl-tRNA(Gln) amidotransferase subunit A
VPDGVAAGLPDAAAQLFARAQDELRSLGATIVSFTEPYKTSVLGFTVDSLGASAVDAGVYHQQFAPAKSAAYGPSSAPLIDAVIAAANAMPAGTYVSLQRQRLAYIEQWNTAFIAHSLDAVLKPGAAVDGAGRLAADALVGGGVTGDFSWADMAGLPVVAITIGRSAATGMPFGIQLGGAPHTEAKLLQMAIDYQAHHDYHEAAPAGLA